jgi:hypothetical protein|tara:strand:- start:303 stop:947 length:645 start_codon:yes stop_codon:yes gene_type:complete
MKKNERGFALVLGLVLLLVMSLMGGSLIVITSGDHKNNNEGDNYQQAFHVAEAGLLAGERFLMNQYMGPWELETRVTASRNLPANTATPRQTHCLRSFPNIDTATFRVAAVNPGVAGWQGNFQQPFMDFIHDHLETSDTGPSNEEEYLSHFYYEYLLHRVGAAPFTGFGASLKKGASDDRIDGMAYRVYSCGVYEQIGRTNLIVSLEALIVVQN